MNRIALIATMLASSAALAGTKLATPATSASSSTQYRAAKPTTFTSSRSSATRVRQMTPTPFNNPFAAIAEQNMRIGQQMMAAAFQMNPFVAMANNAMSSAMMYSPLGYGARFSPLGY